MLFNSSWTIYLRLRSYEVKEIKSVKSIHISSFTVTPEGFDDLQFLIGPKIITFTVLNNRVCDDLRDLPWHVSMWLLFSVDFDILIWKIETDAVIITTWFLLTAGKKISTCSFCFERNGDCHQSLFVKRLCNCNNAKADVSIKTMFYLIMGGQDSWLGKLSCKKTAKKRGHCPHMGGGGSAPVH